jgi:hypothetical protein
VNVGNSSSIFDLYALRVFIKEITCVSACAHVLVLTGLFH